MRRRRRRLIRARRALARFAALLPFPIPELPWRRERPKVELDGGRRRLAVLLTAMYGRHIPIAAPEPARESWLTRRWQSVSPFAAPSAMSASDGESLQLPPVVDAASGTEDAIARYRLLAIEQGERVMRGTAAIAARATDTL